MEAGGKSAVSLEVRDEGVAVITFNNPPVNALSKKVRTGLIEQVLRALADPNVKAIILVGGGRTFPAGADITEFGGSEVFKGPPLVDVIETIEASPKPVGAAIHGTALGGGLEIALGCHFRVGLHSAHVGLPEVKLGILPGAGGTQRLPRLVGVAKALEIIVTGDWLTAQAAFECGILNKVIDDADDLETSVNNLVDSAVLYAVEFANAHGKNLDEFRISKKTARETPEEVGMLCEEMTSMVKKAKRGFIAPLKCIQAVQTAATTDFEKGMKIEQKLIKQLMATPDAEAQQYFFFAERQGAKLPSHIAKQKPKVLPIRSVGIVGAGTMGIGIALNFLNIGIKTILLDNKAELVERAVGIISGIYSSSLKRGNITFHEMDERMQLLQVGLDYNLLSNVDIAIEAVFEDMETKKQVFRQLDAVCKPTAILSSNTSALNVDEIASVTKRKQNVVGTHFFSPAHLMKLIEVIPSSQASPSTIATVNAMAKNLGKVGVIVKNCPGFVGNRMATCYSTEAYFLVEEGALPHQVDRVMHNFGFPMGPFETTDLAGNDLQQNTAKTISSRHTAPQRRPEIDKLIFKKGRLGVKTGKGWYKYPHGPLKPLVDPDVEKMINNYSKKKGTDRRDIRQEEIQERCIYSLINEGFKLLEEGIARCPSDIDVVWVHGFGWPLYKGGPMFYADLLGLDQIVKQMDNYAQQLPNVPHWKASALLRKIAGMNMSLAEYWKKHHAEPKDESKAATHQEKSKL